MNVLCIGGEEFIIVIVIMLVIAGPKRMIHWMYILGTYIAKFRRMWEETVDVLQDEFDEAGVGIKLPRQVPTRSNIRSQAAQAMSGITAPIKETMDDVSGEVKQIRSATKETASATNATVKGVKNTPKTSNGRTSQQVANFKSKSAKKDGFGSWGDSDQEGNSDYGTWSGNSGKKE
jgi:Sec-independent protein translocase protein TatA